MNEYITPRARKEGLILEELGDEILIYDTTNDRAHTLNRTAALVWKLCDGNRSVSEIALAAGKQLQQPFSEQTVWYALGKLDEYHLLEEPMPIPKAMAGISRREFLTKFAVAAAVVPVVKTLQVPSIGTGNSCLAQGQNCTSASPLKTGKGKQNNTNGPGLICCPGLTCCTDTCIPINNCLP